MELERVGLVQHYSDLWLSSLSNIKQIIKWISKYVTIISTRYSTELSDTVKKDCCRGTLR